VTAAIESFLKSAGEPKAVVACPKLSEAQRLAGLLMEAGYDAESVDILGAVQQVVNATSDCELLLIDVRFASLTSGELLAKLRRDPRTAKLPIGVVYSPYDRTNPTLLDSAGGIVVTPDDQQIVEKLARRFTGVQPIMRPQEVASLTSQLEWLLEPRAANAVSKEERLHQAKFALAWARQLAEQADSPFNIQRLEPATRALLSQESFTADAAATLAALGTATGQHDLVELASNASAPLPQRSIAAQAFAESVRRHGILLTTGEIALQYDRYNASATADEVTQKLLGGILDAIEEAGKP
jgi:CheY-like chemotaxis protein